MLALTSLKIPLRNVEHSFQLRNVLAVVLLMLMIFPFIFAQCGCFVWTVQTGYCCTDISRRHSDLVRSNRVLGTLPNQSEMVSIWHSSLWFGVLSLGSWWDWNWSVARRKFGCFNSRPKVFSGKTPAQMSCSYNKQTRVNRGLLLYISVISSIY